MKKNTRYHTEVWNKAWLLFGSNMVGAISILLPGQLSNQTNQLGFIVRKEGIRKVSLRDEM
jgi:hypothetical protein